jgi:hypothetical protein
LVCGCKGLVVTQREGAASRLNLEFCHISILSRGLQRVASLARLAKA